MAQMTEYANVNLVIKADADLTSLLAEFGERVLILDPGAPLPRTEAALEIHHQGGPNGAINAFCDLVESLSGNARGMWDRCTENVLDVGYNPGQELWPYRSVIERANIERAASIRVATAITIYRYRELKNKPHGVRKIES